MPKILDVLREHVLRVAYRIPMCPAPRQHFLRRWWRYRAIHRLFGWKFWAFVVGAAPLDSDLEAFWSELGFVVIQGYGLTETAPIVSLNHPFSTKKGSVGKAIAGVEVKIAPDGEILVRGENVTRGYFNAEEETARAFEDGWFHTGDIGEIADGRSALHPRPQEGDDRHAGGPQRLSGRRRAGADAGGRRPRRSGGRRADRHGGAGARGARARARAPISTRSSGRPTRSSRITRRSAARWCGRSASCRAPKARAS